MYTFYKKKGTYSGGKMEYKELQKIVLDRIALENERAELIEQIPIVETNVKKLEKEMENAQLSKENLENARLKLFFLGCIGKKEERLQQKENEVRKIRGEYTAVAYGLNAMKNRVVSIAVELNGTEDLLLEFLDTLEGETGEEIKHCIITLEEIADCRSRIETSMLEIKPYFRKVEEILESGISNDAESKKADASLHNHIRDIKQILSELIQTLEKYNAVVPEEIKIIYSESWMKEEHYWEEEGVVRDWRNKVKTVENWLYRFESTWMKMKKQQNEAEEIMRSEVEEYLRY